ncbi:MAG: radical SAM family heme chaperone HemW [Treponema sp.]|nr:radical SAM family heme chaperone HemW [Treponema sp.]
MNIVSVYVHIPYCLTKCTYCDFYSIALNNSNCNCKNHFISDKYIDNLIEELKERKKQFKIDKFKTVYVGGGTPSLLSKNQIQKLFQYINQFKIENAEVSFECNPDDINFDFLQTLYDNGVNRISLGIQSLNDEVLAFVKRRADKKTNLHAIECIKKFRKSINKKEDFLLSIDLISGLPKLSCENFLQDLETIVKSGAEHISLYSLIIDEKTELSKNLTFYDENENENQWLLGSKFLIDAGFSHYEVSNFAKKGFESKHNLTYWKKNDYIGIGSGATGSVKNYRYTNSKLLNDTFSYNLNEQVEIIENKDLEFEFLMMGFRLLEGINKNEYKKRFGKSLHSRLGNIWLKWKEKNLAFENGDYFTLGEQGILYLNIFLSEIM